MDYDFSGLCADQLEKLSKRLTSLKKSFLKEYEIALHVINNRHANEKMGEIMIGVDDILNDVARKTAIFYTEGMNKVQHNLTHNLKS